MFNPKKEYPITLIDQVNTEIMPYIAPVVGEKHEVVRKNGFKGFVTGQSKDPFYASINIPKTSACPGETISVDLTIKHFMPISGELVKVKFVNETFISAGPKTRTSRKTIAQYKNLVTIEDPSQPVQCRISCDLPMNSPISNISSRILQVRNLMIVSIKADPKASVFFRKKIKFSAPFLIGNCHGVPLPQHMVGQQPMYTPPPYVPQQQQPVPPPMGGVTYAPPPQPPHPQMGYNEIAVNNDQKEYPPLYS